MSGCSIRGRRKRGSTVSKSSKSTGFLRNPFCSKQCESETTCRGQNEVNTNPFLTTMRDAVRPPQSRSRKYRLFYPYRLAIASDSTLVLLLAVSSSSFVTIAPLLIQSHSHFISPIISLFVNPICPWSELRGPLFYLLALA